ncbi:MAG: MBOAT family protein, partial [Spirosomataceae bacterium]
QFSILIMAILGMETIHYLQRGRSLREQLRQQPTWLRWSLYYGIILSILIFGVFDKPAQFIYFQF